MEQEPYKYIFISLLMVFVLFYRNILPLHML